MEFDIEKVLNKLEENDFIERDEHDRDIIKYIS